MVFGFTVYAMDESIRPIRPDIIMRPICFFLSFLLLPQPKGLMPPRVWQFLQKFKREAQICSSRPRALDCWLVSSKPTGLWRFGVKRKATTAIPTRGQGNTTHVTRFWIHLCPHWGAGDGGSASHRQRSHLGKRWHWGSSWVSGGWKRECQGHYEAGVLLGEILYSRQRGAQALVGWRMEKKWPTFMPFDLSD
jgi:hypothetical protein